MRNQFEEVPRYSLVNSVDWGDTIFVVTPGFIGHPDLPDEPGIAVVTPNGVEREMIAFSGVSMDDGNIVLLEVQRGLHGTHPLAHPAGAEVYFDQGEQYHRLAVDSPKRALKRSLKRLLG